MVVITPDRDIFFREVGEAVEAFTYVEKYQSRLLEAILALNRHQSAIIFHSVQNVRARNGMFESLIELKYGNKYSKFWNSMALYIEKLSLFRNALLHWHPMHTPEMSALQNPQPNRSGMLMRFQISYFLEDCEYMHAALCAFAGQIDKENETFGPTSPGIFARPLSRRNQAALLQPQTPTTQKRQQKSSRPKSRPDSKLRDQV